MATIINIKNLQAKIAELQASLDDKMTMAQSEADGVTFFHFSDRNTSKCEAFRAQMATLNAYLSALLKEHMTLIAEGGRFCTLVGLDGKLLKESFDPRMWQDDIGDAYNEFRTLWKSVRDNYTTINKDEGETLEGCCEKLRDLCERIATTKQAIGAVKSQRNREAPVTRHTVVAWDAQKRRFAGAVWRRGSKDPAGAKPNTAALRATALRRLDVCPRTFEGEIPKFTSDLKEALRQQVFHTDGHTICIRGQRIRTMTEVVVE